MVEIRTYTSEYENELMNLIKQEGEDWKIYWEEPSNESRYRKSFELSITYIAFIDGKVCGYSRSIKETLFIYVCDLLVNKEYRGYGIGKKLMQCVIDEYPDYPVYVMSGNDEYYQKLGAKREGSIFLL